MNSSSLRRLPMVFFGLPLVASGAGCGLVLGLGDFTEGSGTSTGGGGGGAATSSSTGGTGGGASATSSVTSGGTGGMPPMPCMPMATQTCYSGAAGTEGKGLCKGGMETCKDDGTGFGACVGEVVPTPENCAAPQDEDCNGTAPQCTGTSQWGKRFGNAVGDQGANGVALDSKGNTIISGLLSGAVDFGAGNPTTGTAYLTKLDPAGATVFSKALPIGGLMAVDSADDVVLVGHFSGALDFGGGKLDTPGADNIYLAKLAPDGTHLVSKTIGSGSFTLYDMATGPDGSVFIAGIIKGIADLGGGPLGVASTYGAFVAKYDKNGAHVYSRRYGTVGSVGGALAGAIAIDGSGDAVIAVGGMYGGIVDFGGKKLDSANGGFAVVGIDPVGNVLYADQFAGGSNSGINAGLVDASMSVILPGNYDIAVDPTGSVFLVGDFTGSTSIGASALTSKGNKDIFIAKLDPMGTPVWSKSFGSAGDQIATHIAVDMFGNPGVTGVFPDNLNLGNGVFLSGGVTGQHVFGLKLDTDGNLLWAHGSTDALTTKIQGPEVAMNALGEVVFSGAIKSQFTFGMVPAPAGGFFDTYVAKFAP